MEVEQLYQPNEETSVDLSNNTDISQLCRICGNASEYLIPIFEGEGLENELEMKIKKHLPIQVSREDEMPINLCYQCASTLIAWHDLTLGCIQADKKLQHLVRSCFKEESSAQDKIEEGDGVDSIEEMSDIEIEFEEEEEVTTNPSTSSQVNFLSSTSNTNEVPVVLQVAEEKNQAKEVERNKNSAVETTSSERLLQENLPEDTTADITESSTGDKKIITDKVFKKCRKFKLCECSVCGKKFNFVNNLKIHMLNHSDSRPFSCELCGATFKRKDHVRNHRKTIHEGKSITPRPGYVRPKHTFVCNICGIVVGSKLALHDHIRRHTGETPFQCSSCGKSFPAKSALRNHEMAQCSGITADIANHHTKEKRVCDLCNEEFSSYIHFYKHKLKHKMSFMCDVCGKCFALKGQLKNHQIIHSEDRPHKCDKCSKCFKTRTILLSHLKMHADKRTYQCPHCPRMCRQRSDLVVHIRTHTGEKPFVCHICGKGFAQVGDLRKHKITHKFV